jgi:hypothetical protein
MSKVYKNNKKRNIIKTASLALTGGLAVTALASCKSNSNIYSNINADSVYSQIGNYKLTNYELFKNLSWSGASELDNMINDAIVKKYRDEIVDSVENAKDNQQKYVEQLRELFIISAYSISDIDSYFNLNNPDTLANAKQTTIDTLYLEGINLSSADFDNLVAIDSKEEKTLKPISWATLSNAQKEVLKKQYQNLAKKQFALAKLEEEISKYEKDNNKDSSISETDEKYNHYYADSKIITKWNDEFYDKNTAANAILIRFESQDEINETLKEFGVKLYRSNFYYIRQYNVYKDGTQGHNYTDAEYNSVYDDFDFTKESNLNFVKLSDRAVLELYIEMFNYIYTYKQELPRRSYLASAASESQNANKRRITAIIANGDPDDATKYSDRVADGEDLDEIVIANIKENLLQNAKDDVYHTAEDLTKVNVSLKTYLYQTLKDNEFATSGTSNGDYYYMAYKFDMDESGLIDGDTDNTLYYKADVNGDVEQKGEDGKTQKADSSVIDRTRSSNKALIEKVVNLLKEADITDDYANNKVNEAKKDAKISIYEESLSVQYAVSYKDYYSKTSGNAPEDDVVAKVEYDGQTTLIKTSDLFKLLEAKNGVNSAVDALTKKIIKDQPEYKKTEKNIDEYYTMLNNTLTSFANDGLSNYGYSSSIGKYNFLMSYFHSSSVDEIINDVYRVNGASQVILNDYSSDANLIKLLTNYTRQAYQNSFTVSATNLVVYIDRDEDTVADTNFDWNTEYTYVEDGVEHTISYADLAKELISKIMDYLKKGSSTYSDGLSTLVSEYKSSSRFTNGYDTKVDSEGNYSPAEPETYWAKYKRAGLLIKTNDYASVTNGSSFADVPTEIKAELMNIYSRDEFIINSVAQNEYLDQNPYLENNPLVTKDYESGNTVGYNLLVVTSATVNASAKFEQKDDLNGIYTNIYYYYHEKLSLIKDLYNEENALNEAQVKAYILEYADNNTSNTLPSSISSAISAFLSPVYTKYTDSSTQRELLLSWCEKSTKATFSFQNAMNEKADTYKFADGSEEKYSDRFNNIRTINKNQADNYSKLNRFDTVFGGNSVVYNDWWLDLENYIKGNM